MLIYLAGVTQCYTKINPDKAKSCRDPDLAGYTGICDGSQWDCETEGKALCDNDPTCFGITYPYGTEQDMEHWLNHYKGVMKCGSPEIRTSDDAQSPGWNILMKCDPGPGMYNEMNNIDKGHVYFQIHF